MRRARWPLDRGKNTKQRPAAAQGQPGSKFGRKAGVRIKGGGSALSSRPKNNRGCPRGSWGLGESEDVSISGFLHTGKASQVLTYSPPPGATPLPWGNGRVKSTIRKLYLALFTHNEPGTKCDYPNGHKRKAPCLQRS